MPARLLRAKGSVSHSICRRVLRFVHLHIARACTFPPRVIHISSVAVTALNGFDTSINGPGDGGAFGVATVITTTLSNGGILHCGTRLPRNGRGILCMSARRDGYRYRGILRHVLELTKLPASHRASGLRFFVLQRCDPGRHQRVVGRTLTSSPNVNFIIVSNVHSLLCSVGDPDRSISLVGSLVH